MKQSLEHLFIATRAARIAAGDTPDLAQSAAIAAVHRAGMEDAAGIVDAIPSYSPDELYAIESAVKAIRHAAGGKP